jgi:hypothetical protein
LACCTDVLQRATPTPLGDLEVDATRANRLDRREYTRVYAIAFDADYRLLD